jgi:hypothetical protein
MEYPRVKKRPLSEYRELLRLDWDWSSTGIWIIQEPKQKYAGSNLSSYAVLNLPGWLIDRFEYWTDWLESSASWKGHETPDKALLGAYELSLAMDLKRFLGDDYYIECQGREIHDDRAYLLKANSKK